MSRFIVLAFPREPHGGRKGRIHHQSARRLVFNTELEAKTYSKLMYDQSKGKRHYHVIDNHLKATTYRV